MMMMMMMIRSSFHIGIYRARACLPFGFRLRRQCAKQLPSAALFLFIKFSCSWPSRVRSKSSRVDCNEFKRASQTQLNKLKPNFALNQGDTFWRALRNRELGPIVEARVALFVVSQTLKVVPLLLADAKDKIEISSSCVAFTICERLK